MAAVCIVGNILLSWAPLPAAELLSSHLSGGVERGGREGGGIEYLSAIGLSENIGQVKS